MLSLAYHFPQVAAAAVVKTMEDYGVDKLARLQMKFVNDVFLNDKKVCGVLSRMETAAGCDHFKLMIGIGVNLNTLSEHYKDLKIATSVLIETGIRIPTSDFAHSLASNLSKFVMILQTEGFQGYLYEYIADKMYLRGKKVKIYDRNLTTVTLVGIFEALNPDGSVTIVDDLGAKHVINDGRMRDFNFNP